MVYGFDVETKLSVRLANAGDDKLHLDVSFRKNGLSVVYIFTPYENIFWTTKVN